MRKETYEVKLNYIYDADRPRNHYSIDGIHYMNHGDFCECLAKFVLGYKPEKDANTAFDKGHDIPEINASVKSWKCGTTNVNLGKDRQTHWKNFMARELPNTQYIWVYDAGKTVDLWYMNSKEFEEFTEAIASWDETRHNLRYMKSNRTINRWLENKLCA